MGKGRNKTVFPLLSDENVGYIESAWMFKYIKCSWNLLAIMDGGEISFMPGAQRHSFLPLILLSLWSNQHLQAHDAPGAHWVLVRSWGWNTWPFSFWQKRTMQWSKPSLVLQRDGPASATDPPAVFSLIHSPFTGEGALERESLLRAKVKLAS